MAHRAAEWDTRVVVVGQERRAWLPQEAKRRLPVLRHGRVREAISIEVAGTVASRWGQ